MLYEYFDMNINVCKKCTEKYIFILTSIYTNVPLFSICVINLGDIMKYIHMHCIPFLLFYLLMLLLLSYIIYSL